MRKKTSLRAALALIALSALAAIGIGCKQPAAEFPGGWPKKAPKQITSIKAEYVLLVAGRRGAPTRVWYRLPHELRLETTVGGQTFIRNKEGMFRYSSTLKRAVVISPTAGVAAPYNPALFDQVIAASKKVGREKLYGKMCDVRELQKPVGGSRPQDVFGLLGTKLWAWPEGKVILQTYMSDGKKLVMKFFCRSLRYNVPMPDSLFRLPKATPIFDEEPLPPMPHQHRH